MKAKSLTEDADALLARAQESGGPELPGENVAIAIRHRGHCTQNKND